MTLDWTSRSNIVRNPPKDLHALVAYYNTSLHGLLDKHAPVTTKDIPVKDSQPWYSEDINMELDIDIEPTLRFPGMTSIDMNSFISCRRRK